ncbi:helix-turn-helix domain-containing protein [Flavivirga jejuensis]|uniref:Helix-turn-helix domain-containing protein n=1 Tax=Flavivirga jejuensis TaxID=870487 RepID=A0ABT8WIZ5_9FLAO|nr:helix-turn-helix domain-containing protein [Flavivirga jejuensis]MDO5973125.1 helix-turn-helix domain-containing protein [Flavivirga jejuensis]
MNLILDFILISGITVIGIILFLLIKSKQKQLSQKILIIFFVFLLFTSVFTYASFHNIIWLFRTTFVPNDVTTLMIGPLLYLYIKSLFLEQKNLVKNTLKHFVPAVISLIFIAIPTLVFSMSKLDVLSYVISEFIVVIIKLEDVYLILYLILSLQLLSKYRNALKDNYSNLSKYDYKWIKIMLTGALFIISVDSIIRIYELLYDDSIWYQEYLIIAAMLILVIYLGYYGINQSKVLLPDFLLNKNKPIIHKSKEISLSNTKKEEFEQLQQQLEFILTTNKPYLDEDLTLGKLAKQLSTTDKKLSIVLNQYIHTSFFDLINKHRVEAIKERIKLDTCKKYTLFGIACECGFKSRTSFNRIFKKETGFSPSEYKKKHL